MGRLQPSPSRVVAVEVAVAVAVVVVVVVVVVYNQCWAVLSGCRRPVSSLTRGAVRAESRGPRCVFT